MQLFIRLDIFAGDRNQLPFPVYDGVGVIIHHDVKTTDLVRAYRSLGDQNIIDNFGLVHITV